MAKYIELEPKITIGEDFRNRIKIKELESDKDKRITNLEHHVAELASRLESKINS